MFEKLKLARDKSLNMANIHDKLYQLYGPRVSTVLPEGEELRYKTLSCSELTYEAGYKFVNRLGNAFKQLGIKKGDRVAICTSNKIDLPLIIFAIMRLGAIAVPLNWQLKQDEIVYIVDNCGAEHMIVDRWVFESSIKNKDALEGIKNWIMSGPEDECLEGFHSLDEFASKVDDWMEPADLAPDEPVAIFYTSGTTGFPKGALMTSKALLTGQKIAAVIIPTNARKDFGILALPISHIMGFCTSLIGMLCGIKGLFMSRFNPKRVLEAIEKYRATFFVGVPAMYAMMQAQGLDNYDLSSIKAWCSAADAMPKDLAETFRKRGSLLKIASKKIISSIFIEAYGMVELAGICMIKFNLPGISFGQGCVGVPVYPFKVKVVKEDGSLAKLGEIGEIWVKGPGVTKGYYNNPEASKELIKDGWLNTGDLGKKNRLGLIYFVDRKKDMIKSGGYSIFSTEVEQKLMEHPKIWRAVVFGVPHPTKKEVPVAVISLKPGENATPEEIINWAKEHMAFYKAPRAVKIVDEEEIPLGMTMKILKRELKEKYKDYFVPLVQKQTVKQN